MRPRTDSSVCFSLRTSFEVVHESVVIEVVEEVPAGAPRSQLASGLPGFRLVSVPAPRSSSEARHAAPTGRQQDQPAAAAGSPPPQPAGPTAAAAAGSATAASAGIGQSLTPTASEITPAVTEDSAAFAQPERSAMMLAASDPPPQGPEAHDPSPPNAATAAPGGSEGGGVAAAGAASASPRAASAGGGGSTAPPTRHASPESADFAGGPPSPPVRRGSSALDVGKDAGGGGPSADNRAASTAPEPPLPSAVPVGVASTALRSPPSLVLRPVHAFTLPKLTAMHRVSLCMRHGRFCVAHPWIDANLTLAVLPPMTCQGPAGRGYRLRCRLLANAHGQPTSDQPLALVLFQPRGDDAEEAGAGAVGGGGASFAAAAAEASFAAAPAGGLPSCATRPSCFCHLPLLRSPCPRVLEQNFWVSKLSTNCMKPAVASDFRNFFTHPATTSGSGDGRARGSS